MGRLTTHVLDTAHGCPGTNIYLELYREDDRTNCIAHTRTNSDGRCEKPLLEGDAFVPGVYELLFKVGDYYREKGIVFSEPAFLDEIVLRFGIANSDDHYHVPLLVSPYSYSTYRGS
jgi:5-hydroxyisourate hydrolase